MSATYLLFRKYIENSSKPSFFRSCTSIIKATVINVYYFCACVVVFVLYLASPPSSDWTDVFHHEVLVAVSNWGYFRLTENGIQLFIFQIISMYEHLLLFYVA